jgi:hypothetical protein
MSYESLPDWEQDLAAAAHLQRILPDAVLVGGTASAVYARHRLSTDADHVITDLRQHFDSVLAQLEFVAGWQTARVTRPVLILFGVWPSTWEPYMGRRPPTRHRIIWRRPAASLWPSPASAPTRRGIPATLYLGVALNKTELHGSPRPEMEAHAWLRCGPFLITGGYHHERFTVTAHFGG